MPKFRKMHKVSYRHKDEIVNSPHSSTSLECSSYKTYKDGEIYLLRQKSDMEIQYRHEKKEDIKGFILIPVARPEYGTVYQHQGMLLQNLHHRYLYIVIRLPHLKNFKYLVFLIMITMEFAELQTQIHCMMTRGLMIMNYTNTCVKHFRLTICKKWTLLLSWKLD